MGIWRNQDPRGEDETFIYALRDPRDLRIHYIGKADNARARLAGHKWEAQNKPTTYKCNWIKNLLNQGFEPELIFLETVPIKDWELAEITWIQYGRDCGWPLTNLTGGGEGLSNASAETRAKLSNARRGNPLTTETKKKLSEALTGKPGPNLGKNFSAESRRKMSNSRSGEKNPMFGVPSPATGIPWTPERKEKLSQKRIGSNNPMYGRSQTEEHRRKLINAQAKRRDAQHFQSKYIGVQKDCNRWRAFTQFKGKNIYIGMYESEEQAARARDVKAKELWGNLARLNFPEQ